MGRKLLASIVFSALAGASGLEPSFNRESHESFVDPYRHYMRDGHNIESEVLNLISTARRRVWIAAYELRLPQVARALRDAKNRDVDVRIVLEHDNNYDFRELPQRIETASDYEVGRYHDYFAYADLNSDGILQESELREMDAIKIINEAGIPSVDDTEDGFKGSGLMHHKFIVVDSKVVFTGSGNFTWSDYYGDKLKPESRGNANNFLSIESQVVNKAFADEFLIMWGDGPKGLKNSRFGVKKPYRAPISTQLQDGSHITLQFGATSKTYGWEASPNGLIGAQIAQAQTSLDAAFFVWSEQKLVDLIPQKIANKVRILVDPFFGYRPYSELLDMFGLEMPSENCKIEENNRPWTTPALNSGIVNLSPGDLLHHKFAVIDSRKVLTGSHNWSSNANDNNDEVVMVIDSPRIAERYQSEFNRLEQSATIGISPALLQDIKTAQENCHL